MGWIVGGIMATMAALTLVAVGVALRLHFLGEGARAESAMLLDYALDMDDRCAALLADALTAALAESERELDECRQERRKLRSSLAGALSEPRTVLIRRVDAKKPTRPQKEQEG